MPKQAELEEAITIDGEAVEVVEPGTAVAVLDEKEVGKEIVVARPGNLFGTDNPAATVAQATAVAQSLAKVIEDQQLFTTISGKKHVRVEGWTLLGSMMGVFPVMVECEACVAKNRFYDPTKPTDKNNTEYVDGYYAVVEAHTLNGQVVGKAKALCLRNESRWKSADDYAVASMSQTRATSKALRQPLGFIIQLAGYNPTPAEEIPPTPAISKVERMKRRVAEICNEIDYAQEREPGHTWNNLLEQTKLHFEVSPHDLSEEDLAVVGTALGRFKEEVTTTKDKGREFEILGGDHVFALDDGASGYS